MKKFFYGALLPFRGIEFFYREKSLWKHTVGPWSFLAAAYGAIVWLILFLTNKLTAYLNTLITEWPAFIKHLLSGSLMLTALIISSVIILTTLSTFFEIFGNLFFDKMLEDVNERYYHIVNEKLSLRKQIAFTCQGARYGIQTAFLFVVLAVLSLFLPFGGQVILITLTGIRMGYSFLFSPGFLRGASVAETLEAFKNRRAEAAGFGICAYLIQLIPFSMPFTLPGIIIGALMLYNGSECTSREDAKR